MRKASASAPLPEWVQETVAELPPIATMEETMKFLRCSRRTLTRLLSSGRLRAVRISKGGSPQMIPRYAIGAYLASLEHAA